MDLVKMSINKNRLKIIKSEEADDKSMTFRFYDEDHTLGSPLNSLISKDPDVKYSAYRVPHPSEKIMEFRIDTISGTAMEALRNGLMLLKINSDNMYNQFENLST